MDVRPFPTKCVGTASFADGERCTSCLLYMIYFDSFPADYKRHRSACKFIWETAVATLSASQATSIIAGLPYGAGPKLLAQIEGQQRRQTSMALYTLFSQLITIQLASGEKLTQLFGRILEIRNRLKNWRPPIVCPTN